MNLINKNITQGKLTNLTLKYI